MYRLVDYRLIFLQISNVFVLFQAVLQARVGRNVDGINLSLYHQSLQLLRQFEANRLKNPMT